MEGHDSTGGLLAGRISSMTEGEIALFIRQESRRGHLSRTMRSLNDDILSEDRERQENAKAAIRRLGFI